MTLKPVKRGNVTILRITGDPKNAESAHVRICFPGGDVEVTRTTSQDYWVHVRVNTPDAALEENTRVARISDARLDITGKHASDSNVGDFCNPNLYHLAFRVTPEK